MHDWRQPCSPCSGLPSGPGELRFLIRARSPLSGADGPGPGWRRPIARDDAARTAAGRPAVRAGGPAAAR